MKNNQGFLACGVSVWGLGYLGYTTILALQNRGITPAVHDLNVVQLNRFVKDRSEPTDDQVVSWSRIGFLPRLDFSRLTVAHAPLALFGGNSLHFVAIPESSNDPDASVMSRLASVFAAGIKGSVKPPLIIFESAYIPGHIERNFISRLKSHGLVCGRDYYAGAWFRTDWTVESFLNREEPMPVAGFCPKSAEAVMGLFSSLGLPVVALETIKEAEIYVNAMSTIQAMATDFMRQLSLGYPAVDMKRVSRLLFSNARLDECELTMGTGGTKMTLAIDHLIEGSSDPGSLSLLKDFQDLNISSVINYGEFLKRHGFRSVTILGLTYRGNQKDLTLSPSMTLADYLIENGIIVSINDPLFTGPEIKKMVKGCGVVDFDASIFSSEVLIVATDHREYRFLSPKMLSAGKKTRLVIDNYGIWSGFSFGKNIRYCQVGDGSLNLLK